MRPGGTDTGGRSAGSATGARGTAGGGSVARRAGAAVSASLAAPMRTGITAQPAAARCGQGDPDTAPAAHCAAAWDRRTISMSSRPPGPTAQKAMIGCTFTLARIDAGRVALDGDGEAFGQALRVALVNHLPRHHRHTGQGGDPFAYRHL